MRASRYGSLGMGLWEKHDAAVTEEVTEAMVRAHAEATRRRHREVTEAHLVWALLACTSVAAPLASMGLDGDATRAEMGRELSKLCSAGILSFRPPVVAYENALREALVRAVSAGRREIDAKLLLAHLTKRSAPPGFSNLAFLRVVAHGTPEPPPPPEAGQVSIKMLDDPFTTMAHVVETLREVFDVTAEAEKLMMTIHRTGSAVVATLEAGAARRKIDDAHARATAAGMPLRVIGEPVDQPR